MENSCAVAHIMVLWVVDGGGWFLCTKRVRIVLNVRQHICVYVGRGECAMMMMMMTSFVLTQLHTGCEGRFCIGTNLGQYTLAWRMLNCVCVCVFAIHVFGQGSAGWCCHASVFVGWECTQCIREKFIWVRKTFAPKIHSTYRFLIILFHS